MKNTNTISGRSLAQGKSRSAKAPARHLLKIIQSLTLAIPGLLLGNLALATVTCNPSGGNTSNNQNIGATNYFCTGDGTADLTLSADSATNIQNDIVLDNGTVVPKGPTVLGTLTISGNRSGGWYGVRNEAATINSLIVSGQLQTRGGTGIYNNGGNIGRIENSGLIASAGAGSDAIWNLSNGRIGTIRNISGTISAAGGFSIKNFGEITTLVNGQGGNVAALTYTGTLPVNYSIALGSTAASYGKLVATGVTVSASGPMNFSIDSGAVLSTTYAGVLSGISTPLLNNGTLRGTYMGQTWQLVQNGAGIWDLLFPDFGKPGASVPAFSVYKATASLTNNASYGAAQVIDGHANLQALFAGLSGDQAVSNAASQTLPLLTGGSMVSANAALTGVNRVIQARIEASRGLSSGDDFVSGKHFWMKPFGSWADQGDVRGVSGYKASTSGMALGLDDAFSEKTRLGVAFAYARSGIDGNASVAPQRNSVDVYQLIAYGSHSLDGSIDINFQVDAGMNKNNGRRTIAFTSSVASASYDSVSAHAGVGVGRMFKLSDKTLFTPSLRADYTWIKDAGYEETGAGLLNLAVGKRSSDQLVLAADGKLSYQFKPDTALTLNAGVGYDTFKRQSAITAAFAGAPGASFVTYGLQQDPWIGRVGAGLVRKMVNGVELAARYDSEFRTGFRNQTVSLKLRWSF